MSSRCDPWEHLELDVLSPDIVTIAELNGECQYPNQLSVNQPDTPQGNAQHSVHLEGNAQHNVQLPKAQITHVQMAPTEMGFAQSAPMQMAQAQSGAAPMQMAQAQSGAAPMQMAQAQSGAVQLTEEELLQLAQQMLEAQTSDDQMTFPKIHPQEWTNLNVVDKEPPEEIFQPSSPAPAEGNGSAHAPDQPQQTMTKQQNPRVVVHNSEEELSHVPMQESVEQMMVHTPSVGLPVSSAQPLNFQIISSSNGSNVAVPAAVFAAAIQPQQMPMAQQALSGQLSHKGGGVVDVPALTDMEGEYGFSVTIEEKERTTKSPMWLMSKITKKLYTNINKAVPFEIHLKRKVPRDEFHVRAVAVFSSAQFLRTNVTRCPNHASTADITNHDFPYPAHVVRADHPEAQYDESPNGRLSVVVPLDILQDGSDYTPILLRFMCLGSCVGGINRRPIAIILTLENSEGIICGRKVIDVRVCACPTRDIRTDEMNRGVKRRGSTVQEKPIAPARKKPKNIEPKTEPLDDNKTYYLPVQGLHLYKFLEKMKAVYYETHPEYAAKYPMDARLPDV